MREVHLDHVKAAGFVAVMISLLSGCQRDAVRSPVPRDSTEQRASTLQTVPSARAAECLAVLGIHGAAEGPDGQRFTVAGSPAQLEKARVVLDLIDTNVEFVVETLAPAAKARSLPSNEQIAQALGGIAIGTFAEPPPSGAVARGIVDIHEDSVVAILPSRFKRAIHSVASGGVERPPESPSSSPSSAQNAQDPAAETSMPAEPPHAQSAAPKPDSATADQHAAPPEVQASAKSGLSDRAHHPEPPAERPAVKPEPPEVISIPANTPAEVKESKAGYRLPPLANGDLALDLDLPQTMDLTELLDLAAEYLDLDYMYEPSQIQGQTVTLKLRGKLQGQIRVKDLYPLLESVLKFKGFAMTRHEGRVVTVVPLADALHVDPRLVGRDTDGLEAGDMVITRVLQLQYVDALSATHLLDDMKLSVAVSPIAETKSLIVTCYADRMTRIEELLRMIDRPGRGKEFRSRLLKYTAANVLLARLQSLAQQLGTVPVTIAPLQKTAVREAPQVVRAGQPQGPTMQAQPASRTADSRRMEGEPQNKEVQAAVYLDADERTNRVLMLGYQEQVELVEKLIDALDLPGHDLRLLQIYYLNHLDAEEARAKLEGLGVIGSSQQTVARAPSASSGQPVVATAATARNVPTEAPVLDGPQAVVLEAANALLVNATQEQHVQVERITQYLDVATEDTRVLRVYDIEYVDAADVKKKLGELGIVVAESDANPTRAYRAVRATPESSGAGTGRAQFAVVEEPQAASEGPQVVVREATNSLVVYATEKQHARIADTVRHLDAQTLQQAIPYEIYFLENQEPGHLAEVLQKIIQETLKDDQAKIEQVARRAEDKIVIVPDEGTFSVIVYAARKNQEWISKLITALDKRRPQVLIDVTLVEITETDAFNYDLDIIRGWSGLTNTSGISGVDPNEDMIGTFARSAGGSLTAFYGDRQVQALLTAVQSKNYGRVLAKPKVLVNDNEAGLIKTTDTTYVETRSGIPVSSGAVGNQQNFVETSLKYEPYEAGITLDIKPHISEGDLLRLDISLVRSDFLSTEDATKPPNTTASEVKTAVTVPDGSTIILGGLLKLNQNKGGQKVPLLGDIPIVGGLFRSASTSDRQSKLYVFVKAEIIRPADHGNQRLEDLERISERDRQAFEEHEAKFQGHEQWPGIKPKPVPPVKVLDAR